MTVTPTGFHHDSILNGRLHINPSEYWQTQSVVSLSSTADPHSNWVDVIPVYGSIRRAILAEDALSAWGYGISAFGEILLPFAAGLKSAGANATLSFFTDRTTWENALGGPVSTEDFNGITPFTLSAGGNPAGLLDISLTNLLNTSNRIANDTGSAFPLNIDGTTAFLGSASSQGAENILITLPLAIGSGQFINPFRVWAAPEWALVMSSAIHVVVYAGYVWLVGRAGAVFAVQVSYLVTGFGVAWAMTLLGESYSHYIWAALALVMTGVFLVQPRRQDTLAPQSPIGDTGH